MMKLSTMLKVDSTVDIQWQSRIAEQILEHWEHDQGGISTVLQIQHKLRVRLSQ